MFIDTDVRLKSHIAATVRSCFAAVPLVRSVRRCLPHQALLELIRALVVSKVDYCSCSVLAGVSSHLLDRLQSFLELIFSARRSDYITPLLHDLHWLRVPETDTVPTLCTGISFPARHSSDIPRRKPATNNRCRRPSTHAFSRHPVADRSAHTAINTLDDRSFPAAAARSWNRLSVSIRNASSVATFRRHLKNHLFRSSYYTN